MKLRLATMLMLAAATLIAPNLAQAQALAPVFSRRPPVVPPASVSKVAPAAVVGQSLIDVNSADASALDSLPGVGAARAKAIIAGRPYSSKSDLKTRKILPPDVFAKVEPMMALANVNSTSAADMAKMLPNVGPVRAEAIVKNRPYVTLQDLVAKGALTQAVFDGIKSLITTK